jgi:uncharacterized protein (DUF1684 family)
MRAQRPGHAHPARLALPAFAVVSVVWFIAALALVASSACSSKPPDDGKDYTTRLSTERAEKDDFFQKENDPIPQDRKAELLPLAYFPIDPDYHVVASLSPTDDQTILQIPTSSGAPRPMRRAGTLEFTLKGQPLKLTAFTDTSDRNLNHLTVMFSDLTSGPETYPAGRYIDLNRSPTGVYELDFNRAYQPYCYYNASFECPYPPAENRLPLPIHAGERLKHSEK